MPSTFDEVLKKHVGEFGKYQILQVLLLSSANFFLCFTSMSSVFIADNPDHHCQLPSALMYLNCSTKKIRAYAIPLIVHNGKESNDQCHLFKTNYTSLTEIDVCPDQQDTHTFAGNTSKGEKVKCDAWEFDTSVYKSTVVTEWNLVCDRAWLAKNTAGLYMAARIVGTVVCGWLADR